MKKQIYGNESISSLKGAERVRKRPGVIFGLDGIEGCQHTHPAVGDARGHRRSGLAALLGAVAVLDRGSAEYRRGVPFAEAVKPSKKTGAA